MRSHPVGPADIELPPTEPIDISWVVAATTTGPPTSANSREHRLIGVVQPPAESRGGRHTALG